MKENLVPLSKRYPSIHAVPIIDKVDRSIFSRKYFGSCLNCDFCNDSCCQYGADVDVVNYHRLMKNPGPLEQFVGVPSSKWFKENFSEDSDFPGGQFVRTNVRDGACIFLNRVGRGCLIHSYCLANNIDLHTIKPMISTLFPVTFDHGVLYPSREIADKSLRCCGQGQTVYRGARADIGYYFGEELLRELDELETREDLVFP